MKASLTAIICFTCLQAFTQDSLTFVSMKGPDTFSVPLPIEVEIKMQEKGFSDFFVILSATDSVLTTIKLREVDTSASSRADLKDRLGRLDLEEKLLNANAWLSPEEKHKRMLAKRMELIYKDTVRLKRYEVRKIVGEKFPVSKFKQNLGLVSYCASGAVAVGGMAFALADSIPGRDKLIGLGVMTVGIAATVITGIWNFRTLNYVIYTKKWRWLATRPE